MKEGSAERERQGGRVRIGGEARPRGVGTTASIPPGRHCLRVAELLPQAWACVAWRRDGRAQPGAGA